MSGLWIAVDFDGTTHDWNHPVPNRRMGPPMEGAIEAIKRLKAAGHTITIFTVRGDQPFVEEWLTYWGLTRYYDYDGITNIKLAFDLIIDDRALRYQGKVGEWEHIADGIIEGWLP